MNWVEFIKAIKDLKTFRFYFITLLTFFLILGNIYKDALTIAVKDVSFNQVEFRECKNLKGLEDALEKINAKHDFVETYAVYLYQPKEKFYYKKIITTNSDIIKSTTSLQGSYIEDQPTFNALLKDNDYFIIEKGSREQDTRFMTELNIDYIFVYKLYRKEIIGEIIITLKRKPNPIELEELIKEVSPLIHMYI